MSDTTPASDYECTDEDLALLESSRYRQLGFTGQFALEAALVEHDGWPHTEEELAEFEARLPARVPFGTNSSWLALKITARMPSPMVVLVRTDAAAIMDLAHGGGPEVSRRRSRRTPGPARPISNVPVDGGEL